MKYTFLFLLIATASTLFGQYSSTPIMLSLPMENDTIEEDEPNFVWQTTLSNLQNDPRLNVQLSVVQVGENQTPVEAMAENNPVFLRQNLLSSSLNYSSIDHELVEGTWYAWQVVLFYNGVQVQQSEVFKFIKTEPVVPVPVYIPLRKQVDNSIYTLSNDQLYICTNEPGNFQLSASLKGKKTDHIALTLEELVNNEPIAGTESIQRTEMRYYHCDLSELDLKNGVYRFEWAPANGLRFVVLIEKD